MFNPWGADETLNDSTPMPQRQLRPAIRQSKRWNRQPYIGQTLYVRLLTLVDDYGRYDADAELIRSECFPYGDPDGQPIPVETIDKALIILASADMLTLYMHEGHRYLQLKRWHERVRSESRWPEPTSANLLSFDSNCCQMSATPVPVPTATEPSSTPTPTSTNGTGLGDVKPTKQGKKTVELMAMAKAILGEEELRKCHDRWYKRAVEHPKDLEEILIDTRTAALERQISTTPAKYAEGACKRAKI